MILHSCAIMDLDSNKPFIWRKKYEEQGIPIDVKAIEAENRRKAEENRIELAKIKERQRKRDLEYQQKLSDNEYLSRQKEAEHHEQWEQQMDDFLLKQQRHGSKVRIREGRAKPIDLLSYYIDVFGSHDARSKPTTGMLREENIDLSESPIELLNPCDWFNGLRQSDLETLEPDIEKYMSTDCEDNQQYWRDLLEITRNELIKLRAAKGDLPDGDDIHPAVLPDLISLIESRKTIDDLDDLEQDVEDYLHSNDPSIDEAFYKFVLSRLRAHRARVRLTENHKSNLNRQKNKILDAKKIKTDAHKSDTDTKEEQTSPGRDNTKSEPTEDSRISDHGDEEPDAAIDDQFEMLQLQCISDYENGGYSPKKLAPSELDADTVCTNFEQEYELLCQYRNRICNASSLDETKIETMTQDERAFMSAASKGMNKQEEAVFSCEAAVRGADNRNLTYAWADKYQPRKPRYFNRVHTGFEWNKYNQTHYDIDNPPPKVVQGYKFNIFYPDLIDKSKAPTFTISPCADDRDFCIIRFSAGPPYEDIAFKIVNREWNNSHKSGYRCQFINNMLQLWFQFKRYRYRR